MAGEGALVTALVTLLAGACFGYVGVRAHREARGWGSSESWLFLLLAATLLPTAVRHVVAYAAGFDARLGPLDAALHQALHVPAAASMVVLMHLTARRLSGVRVVAWLAAALYAALALVGVGFLYTGGFTLLDPGMWSAPGSVEREAAASMVLAFFALPSLMASGLLILAAQSRGGAAARRLRMTSLSATVFYMAFTMDAVGAEGLGLLALRALMAGAAVLAYAAHVPLRFDGGGGGGLLPSARRD